MGVALGWWPLAPWPASNWNGWLVLAPRIGIVAAAGLISNHLADRTIRRARVRRLLGGNEWVDGTWVNVVRGEDGRPLRVGIVHFVPDGPSVRYGGQNYDPETGVFDGAFSTTASSFTFPDLHFVYESESRAEGNINQMGGGRLRFVPTQTGPPRQSRSGAMAALPARRTRSKVCEW